GDRLARLGRRVHLNEAEPTRPPGGAVGDDRCRLAVAHLGEQRLKVRARGVEGKVPDEDLLAPAVPLANPGRAGSVVAVAWAKGPVVSRRDGGSAQTKGRHDVYQRGARRTPRRLNARLSAACRNRRRTGMTSPRNRRQPKTRVRAGFGGPQP